MAGKAAVITWVPEGMPEDELRRALKERLRREYQIASVQGCSWLFIEGFARRVLIGDKRAAAKTQQEVAAESNWENGRDAEGIDRATVPRTALNAGSKAGFRWRVTGRFGDDRDNDVFRTGTAGTRAARYRLRSILVGPYFKQPFLENEHGWRFAPRFQRR